VLTSPADTAEKSAPTPPSLPASIQQQHPQHLSVAAYHHGNSSTTATTPLSGMGQLGHGHMLPIHTPQPQSMSVEDMSDLLAHLFTSVVQEGARGGNGQQAPRRKKRVQVILTNPNPCCMLPYMLQTGRLDAIAHVNGPKRQ
jgi:hypothetical protein